MHVAITATALENGADYGDATGDDDDAASSVVSDMSDDVLTTQTEIRNLIDNMDADDEPLVT